MPVIPLLSALALCAALAAAVPASVHAAWIDVHGTSGAIEFPENAIGPIGYRGFGLEFNTKAGTTNWIHYQIPTGFDGARRVRYLYLRYQRSNTAARITRVDVYSSGSLVKSKTLPTSTSVGGIVVNTDLGAHCSIGGGLGLSFRLDASNVANIRMSNVAANLVP